MFGQLIVVTRYKRVINHTQIKRKTIKIEQYKILARISGIHINTD